VGEIDLGARRASALRSEKSERARGGQEGKRERGAKREGGQGLRTREKGVRIGRVKWADLFDGQGGGSFRERGRGETEEEESMEHSKEETTFSTRPAVSIPAPRSWKMISCGIQRFRVLA